LLFSHGIAASEDRTSANDAHTPVRIPRGSRITPVNAVVPGPVCTPLNPADHDVDGVSKFGSETPMKPPARPEEIAPALVFLAAPSCSSCLTREISIIGGYTGG
jgi:NAD(P)-dependent dehydrogenase (short-subunit alcohol dehydrogenase family)